MSGLFLIAGLGNPGTRYAKTRHNAGFLGLDNLARELLGDSATWKSEGGALVLRSKLGATEVLLVKPQEFMNRSGEAIKRLLDYYKVELSKLIVVHDEIDLPFGSLRIKQGGGDGGHNGIKSIVKCAGSADFVRVRVGVGRPVIQEMQIADWVLEKFSGTELPEVDRLLERVSQAIQTFCSEGLLVAQNRFNNIVRDEGAS